MCIATAFSCSLRVLSFSPGCARGGKRPTLLEPGSGRCTGTTQGQSWPRHAAARPQPCPRAILRASSGAMLPQAGAHTRGFDRLLIILRVSAIGSAGSPTNTKAPRSTHTTASCHWLLGMPCPHPMHTTKLLELLLSPTWRQRPPKVRLKSKEARCGGAANGHSNPPHIKPHLLESPPIDCVPA